MTGKLTRILVLAGLLSTMVGCAINDVQTESMISAADFEKMIRVEVREIEPMPIEDVVAATN